MAKEVSKTIHDIPPFYVHDIINIKISNYNFWRGKQASLSQVKTTRYDLRSFLYETAQIWNSLPSEVRVMESFSSFPGLLLGKSDKECIASTTLFI